MLVCDIGRPPSKLNSVPITILVLKCGDVQKEHSMATFVLVHGAWHGGWCWKYVTPLLHAAGHDVFTPTLTGVGERTHLARPNTGLETHIQDVIGPQTTDHRPGAIVGRRSSVVGRRGPALARRRDPGRPGRPLVGADVPARLCRLRPVRRRPRACQRPDHPGALACPPGRRNHPLTQNDQPHARGRQAYHGRGRPAGIH
jgi:hypothetical protein